MHSQGDRPASSAALSTIEVAPRKLAHDKNEVLAGNGAVIEVWTLTPERDLVSRRQSSETEA